MKRPIALPKLAASIDQTLLTSHASEDDIRRLVEGAAKAGFAAAMVPPCWVSLAAALLAGTKIAPATVIAFPFGYAHPRVRIVESEQAVDDGATELDTVINLSLVASGEDRRAQDDLSAWVRACRAAGRRVGRELVLKVIIETALLDTQQKVRAAEIAVAAGADFVKTSTGYGPGGATVEDVRLLVRSIDGRARVKASGGIRDFAAALALFEAGADRLGTSHGLEILAAADAFIG